MKCISSAKIGADSGFRLESFNRIDSRGSKLWVEIGCNLPILSVEWKFSLAALQVGDRFLAVL